MIQRDKLPLASVVITTYNRAKFVQKAIDSVLSQSYQNFELFVIDDGSTDETREIISDKYAGNLTYIWQENQGESIARNVGISKSSGKYLAFLDSDDKWHPEKLSVLVPKLEQRREKDEDIALICSSVWLIDDQGKLITSKPVGRQKKLEKFSLEDFFYRPRIFAPPSNAIFVKKFVEEVGGFDEDIRYGEDWALLLKLRSKYKFIYIDSPFTYFRIHNTHQQSATKLENIDHYLTDHLKIIEQLSKIIENPSEINKIKAHKFEQTAYWYFNYNSWEKGAENLNKAVALDPNCTENGSRVIQNLATTGLENAKFHENNTVSDMLNHFTNKFYPKISTLWPSKGLTQKRVMRKAKATFCHKLMCENEIQKSRLEYLQLALCSLRHFRYWRSLTTWRTIIFNLLPRKAS